MLSRLSVVNLALPALVSFLGTMDGRNLPRLPRKQQVPEGSCEKVKIEFVIATVVNENTGAVGSDVTLQDLKSLFS